MMKITKLNFISKKWLIFDKKNLKKFNDIFKFYALKYYVYSFDPPIYTWIE